MSSDFQKNQNCLGYGSYITVMYTGSPYTEKLVIQGKCTDPTGVIFNWKSPDIGKTSERAPLNRLFSGCLAVSCIMCFSGALYGGLEAYRHQYCYPQAEFQ